MRRLIILIWFIPNALMAQDSSGIQFEKPTGWQEILAKAKTENKYIFVDCYATWCGPCKLMDEKTYPSEKVGQYLNAGFISVRMQVDSTNKDDAQIKGMYGDVHKMVQEYRINSLPTFLFFSPDGRIVHRDTGYRNDSDFIKLARSATDTSRQVYTLLDNYQQGKRNYSIMPYLSSKVSEFDRQLGKRIADDYIINYLLRLKNDELFTQRHIEFIARFIESSKDSAFDFVLHHSEKVDGVMSKDYAENIISFIIKEEEIDPLLWRDNKPVIDKPDWHRIGASIRNKYGKYYFGRTVLDAKLQWYESKGEWPDYCKILVQRVEKYGPFGPVDVYFQFNWDAWHMFLHSTDKKQLIKALAWSDSSLRQMPPVVQCIDTYANLLYKLGRKDEAIIWEQKALDTENQRAQKQGKMKGYFTDELSATLAKIQRGEPTW